ncbi:unnamed protein product [Alternaria alternata]
MPQVSRCICIYRLLQSTDVARCTSTGRKCEGYTSSGGAFQVHIWSYSQTSGPQNAISTLGDLGDNARFLEFYYHCARPALSTSFDKEFWSRIAIQMAHSEPAVRHALVALGALCQTEPGDMKHACSRFITNRDRKVMLSHYNLSIRCLVDRMGETTYSHELGLVICLLFVCIEFLQGNYHTGLTHLNNGFRLIAARRRGLAGYQNQSAGIALPSGSRSSQSTIEETVVPIFTRGMAQDLLYGFKALQDLEVPSPTPAMYSRMQFQSLSEAQRVYFELRNATIVHLYMMGRKAIFRQEPNNDAYNERDNLVACHRIWYEIMRRFELHHKLSDEESIAASALKASYHTTLVYVSCSASVIEKTYDAYLDDFKEIVRSAREVIDLTPPAKSHTAHFTLDIAIIPQLYFVATRCRCPTTRREAVALLERNPPREGLWDAQQHVVVSKRAIELEEAEVDPRTGWPVEATRLWNCVPKAGMDHNGGFWVAFIPARWIGILNADGTQKTMYEYFVL